jgi:hypothetical protein
MSNESFTTKHRTLGRVAAWAVFSVLVIYAVTLVLGFLSLKSPQEPIGDPYFSILELLIIHLAPLMVVSMVAVHAYASPANKAYSFTALAFMLLLAACRREQSSSPPSRFPGNASFMAQAGTTFFCSIVGRIGRKWRPHNLEGGHRSHITPRIRCASA